MCRRHGNRRQPPMVALAGAIYGAYQSRKEKRAEASAQDIGLEGGKYSPVPQLNHSDDMDEFDLHEKGAPPPDYEDVVGRADDTLRHDADAKEVESGVCDDVAVDEKAFLAAGDEDGSANKARDDGVKMGFFGRMHAKKEEKRLEREEKREGWRANRRAFMESKAERRAEWRAGRGGRGCGRQTC